MQHIFILVSKQLSPGNVFSCSPAAVVVTFPPVGGFNPKLPPHTPTIAVIILNYCVQ